MKNLVRAILLASILTWSAQPINAVIVNIDAKINSTTNPVVMFFDKGTYDVTPIGIRDGGAYTAWNCWIGGGYPPPSHAGWKNDYSLSSNEFAAYTVKDDIIHSTALHALSNAISTSFTLKSSGNVNFFITDLPNYYFDNVGGISLLIQKWNRTYVPDGILCSSPGRILRLDDQAGNKVELFCATNKNFLEFHLKYNGERVGRCTWDNGINPGYIEHIGQGGWNKTTTSIKKTFWRSIEPGTNLGVPGLKDWKTFVFDVESDTLMLRHWASADGPSDYGADGYNDNDWLIKPAKDIDPIHFNPDPLSNEGPMTTIVMVPGDLDWDGDCDAFDFALADQAVGHGYNILADTDHDGYLDFELIDQAVGHGYNELADTDHDGYVDEGDVEQLFPVVPIHLDIKPLSCPNPLNVNSGGVFPVAILGGFSHDVANIDVGSLRLEGVAPIRASIEDISSPINRASACECGIGPPDSYNDLTLEFQKADIISALGSLNDGEELLLTLQGHLLDGTPIEGVDCVVIIDKK